MDDDRQRLAAVERLNQCVVELNDARKRYNDAKAQLGTAKQQLHEAKTKYRSARLHLDKLLPEVSDDDDAVEEG